MRCQSTSGCIWVLLRCPIYTSNFIWSTVFPHFASCSELPVLHPQRFRKQLKFVVGQYWLFPFLYISVIAPYHIDMTGFANWRLLWWLYLDKGTDVTALNVRCNNYYQRFIRWGVSLEKTSEIEFKLTWWCPEYMNSVRVPHHHHGSNGFRRHCTLASGLGHAMTFSRLLSFSLKCLPPWRPTTYFHSEEYRLSANWITDGPKRTITKLDVRIWSLRQAP